MTLFTKMTHICDQTKTRKIKAEDLRLTLVTICMHSRVPSDSVRVNYTCFVINTEFNFFFTLRQKTTVDITRFIIESSVRSEKESGNGVIKNGTSSQTGQNGFPNGEALQSKGFKEWSSLVGTRPLARWGSKQKMSRLWNAGEGIPYGTLIRDILERFLRMVEKCHIYRF